MVLKWCLGKIVGHKELTEQSWLTRRQPGLGWHGTKTTKGKLIMMINESMTRLALKRYLKRSGHKECSQLIERQLGFDKEL